MLSLPMSSPTTTPLKSGAQAVLCVGALGVVFGDIGTSPLYTMRECMAHLPPGEQAAGEFDQQGARLGLGHGANAFRKKSGAPKLPDFRASSSGGFQSRLTTPNKKTKAGIAKNDHVPHCAGTSLLAIFECRCMNKYLDLSLIVVIQTFAFTRISKALASPFLAW
eukprot:gene40098-biopygen31985